MHHFHGKLWLQFPYWVDMIMPHLQATGPFSLHAKSLPWGYPLYWRHLHHISLGVRVAVNQDKMLQYIAYNAKWPMLVTSMMDWKSQRTHTMYRPSLQNYYLKVKFHLFATMVHPNKMDKTFPPTCPRCRQAPVKYNHVLQRPSALTKTTVNWQQDRRTSIDQVNVPLCSQTIGIRNTCLA